MGRNKVTTRTLPSGEKIRHHPDGRKYLIPGPSAVVEQLENQRPTEEWLDAEKQYHGQKRVEKKVNDLASGNAVPADKRPC